MIRELSSPDLRKIDTAAEVRRVSGLLTAVRVRDFVEELATAGYHEEEAALAMQAIVDTDPRYVYNENEHTVRPADNWPFN